MSGSPTSVSSPFLPQRTPSLGTRAVILAAVTGALGACSMAPASTSFADWLRREAELRQLPGLSVAVMRAGEVVHAFGVGLADLEQAVPATATTIYELGSCTKAFTALAVLRLVQRGALSLDDPLTRWFPDTPAAWRTITIRHLLTHTSGLRNHVAVPGFLDAYGTGLDFSLRPSRSVLERSFLDLPQEFAPGTSWAYDNTGYCLLAGIVERCSGVNYWQFVVAEVASPLGLRSVRSTDPRPLVAERAAGYGLHDGAFENRAPLPPELASGAGSLAANVLDLARLPSAMAGCADLDATLLHSACSPTRGPSGEVLPYDYGFGWFVGSHHGTRYLQHSGGTPGCSATVYHFPDAELTVAMLANHGDRMLDALAIEVAGRCDASLRRPRATTDPMPLHTERIRRVVADLLAGEFAPEQFTAPMRAFLTSATGRGFWQWHREHGELTAFTFASAEQLEGDDVLHFRARLGAADHWLTARVNPTGAIAQLYWW